ncbi:Polyribonucleotide nucleotidyltransferase [uncultured archaeon]|nr:Polyribonucleotide nucleotidyltransferase [uncultured archaeon]
MEDSEALMIPHDRIGALIGPGGTTKRLIEKKTGTKITVDSSEGEIEIEGKGDAFKYWKAIKVVKAIGRGFSPEHAMRLLNDEAIFELIEIQDFTGKSENAIKSKRGRVIGEHGMARDTIERETGANISVYGKTVGIIGMPDEVEKAKKAVSALLLGAGHEGVFHRLERGSSEGFEL